MSAVFLKEVALLSFKAHLYLNGHAVQEIPSPIVVWGMEILLTNWITLHVA
jgi:hypothetical protein